jgi:D-3-phosphoglycerate dehydrogenase / 2-oxoglutarate reductase
VTTTQKFKVVVQKPRGPSYDLGDEAYSLEREGLDPVGAAIVQVDASSTEEFLAEARDADALIARHRRLHAGIIEGLQKCIVIGCGSVGSDTVDVAAATRAGIVVTNVPDVFIDEVADHALMLILAAVRRLNVMERMARDGHWWDARPALASVPRLFGQTLGLISFGNVAKAVARRAQVFGLRVMAYDPYVSELVMTTAGVEPVSLEELLERSDIVSLHAPLNEETRHLMNAARFAQMKTGSVFVNTGRGPCVDETALQAALERGQVAVAALDVLEEEPPKPDNPLLGMSNVILTPHVASATSRMMPETRRRLGREIALVLRGFWPRSCVNPGVLPRTPLERWQPYPMERGPNR